MKLDQGAEAVIIREGDVILKDRVPKSYRHPLLDESLRKTRTRKEAKMLSELGKIGFPSPRLIDSDDKSMRIRMSFQKGAKLRDVFEDDYVRFSQDIGHKLALLHSHKIIHSDLTTSNMILDGEVHFIDFGLSFISDKIEDRAVDLHLLKQAIESKHPKVHTESFEQITRAYLAFAPDNIKVIDRLKVVERRGRYKHKGE